MLFQVSSTCEIFIYVKIQYNVKYCQIIIAHLQARNYVQYEQTKTIKQILKNKLSKTGLPMQSWYNYYVYSI